MNKLNRVRAIALVGMFATSIVAASASPVTASPTFQPGTGPCSAVPEGVDLIIPHSGGVAMTNSTGFELLDAPIAAGPNLAVRAPDGTVWVEASPRGTFGVHRIVPGGPAELVAEGDVSLSSVGWLGGRSAAVVIDANADRERPDEPDNYGAVIVEYSDGEQVDVKAAGGPEYGALSVTIGAERLAEGAWADLTESFAYYGPDGTVASDWFDPTQNAPYNAPPLYQWPIAAVDADDPTQAELSWTEGPDFDGATNETVGGWNLVVADATTGEESLRLDLGDPGDALTYADFDGRFWVGTFNDAAGGEGADATEPGTPDGEAGAAGLPARVIVVDTQAATPSAVDAVCPPGVTATIDRNGDAEPPGPPAPTAPPTTVAPTTTAPSTSVSAPAPTTTSVTTAGGGCDEYVPSGPEYPIRRCQTGFEVRVTQIVLGQRGYDVEADGDFGAATEQAVRAFQADAGLEVDGLVGPDTWSALYVGSPLSTGGEAVDVDGSGSIDPWEVSLDGPGQSYDDVDWVGFHYEIRPPDFEIGTSEGVLSGIVFRAGWIVGDVTTSSYGVDYVVIEGETHMLWFNRPAGPPAPGVVVVDAIAIPTPTGNEVVTSTCLLDGAADDTVAAIVVDEGDPPYPAVKAAWQFDAAGESIVEIDLGRVTCDVEGD